MSLPLFEQIHDDAYLCKRTHPVSMEEFIAFGLLPEDYVQYIALQYRLQSELLLFGSPKSETYTTKDYRSKTTYPTLEKFISFCIEKNLIWAENKTNIHLYLGLFDRDDAEYYHDWFRYPKESDDFRLAIERKLSRWWDPVDAYLSEVCSDISFDYDEYTEHSDGSCWIAFDSPVRVKQFIPESESYTYLSNSEVRKLLVIIQSDKRKLEREIAQQLSFIPTQHDATAVIDGLPKIKKLFELIARQEIIEDVYDTMSRAASTPDIYRFKESDVLVVYCGEDKCQLSNHLLSTVKAEFEFYGKPDNSYFIQRCAHCAQFRLSLDDLTAMFEKCGVPRAQIIYEGGAEGNFTDFAETSIFYDMGYTVSQTVGLSAVRRQAILKHAIETGKASKSQVLSFLKQRMNINGMKAGNEIAYRKWKDDYECITKL